MSPRTIEVLVRAEPAAAAAMAIATLGVATILGAWFFQYVLKLPPCPLCLEQRTPYYVAILLAALVAIAARYAAPRLVLTAGLGAIALAMLYGASLGIYHAGIEWKWWAGPPDCTGTGAGLGSAADLMKELESARVVRCDEAAWRFLGLSLAGYNVLISLAIVAVALWGARATPRGVHGSSSVSQ